MARFLKGNDLNAELEKLLETAEGTIILISPYIKLHDRYKSSLLTHLKYPNLEIIVLFGKNEDDMSKSMKQEDFDFFKQFPNVEILFENRLHAKYYANETKAILTSMNLYEFSQNNNIEAGVLIENKPRIPFSSGNNLDNDSWEYFSTVLEQAELLFKKTPVYEKKNMFSATKYINSEIEIDKLSEFFANKTYTKVYKNNIKKSEGKSEINIEKATQNKTGYCIRTGVEIPFDIERPMNYESYKMWNKYKDPDFAEKYCHYSGEPSNGKTSMSKPILSQNWKAAKEKFKF